LSGCFFENSEQSSDFSLNIELTAWAGLKRAPKTLRTLSPVSGLPLPQPPQSSGRHFASRRLTPIKQPEPYRELLAMEDRVGSVMSQDKESKSTLRLQLLGVPPLL